MKFPVTAAMRRRFLSTLEGVEGGTLALTTPEGTTHRFGSGPEVGMTLHDWSVLPMLLARGDVGLGETWMAGLWSTPALEDLLALLLTNLGRLDRYAQAGLAGRLRFLLADRVFRANSLRGAARNIRAHYDLGNDFYRLWLDPGMTYSSALFGPDEDDIAAAQTRKYDRILSRLSAGETVLDIGCGWGGFAERAAAAGRGVTGITLSPSQKTWAEARLGGRAEIRLQDYRQVAGRFDNIVSIEMIEAVGERYWPAYFATLKARLAEGGRAVVQAILVPDADFPRYRRGSDFIRQHTFPGGMLPCNAAIAEQARRAGLAIRDNFAFGQHYARTCRIWAQNLLAQAPRIRRLGFDEPFLRGWQFYLEGCAAAFATGCTDVAQIELAHA